MAGLDPRRLVLVESTVEGAGGRDSFRQGTGYFLTDELVLTAQHVLAEGTAKRIEVRVGKGAGEPKWREAAAEPAWQDLELDAALIRVNRPLAGLELPSWAKRRPTENVEWQSSAYPLASTQESARDVEWNTAGLKGTLYFAGGEGSDIPYLDLGVVDEARGEGWQGISGAPVFVGDDLVGIVKSSLLSYESRRLAGVPINLLLQDPGFRLAIAQQWLEPLPSDTWFLVLLSEGNATELADTVRGVIENRAEEIAQVAGRRVVEKLVIVGVAEVLEKPERWLRFVQAMCAAPVMIVDVTGFQPAVMLLLGIRAVVRRGVTVATTAERVDESHLSKLPFNIQEIKLVEHDRVMEIDHPRHPRKLIGDAIAGGLKQLSSHPGYLDLPVFDAVRCPKPPPPSNGTETSNKSVDDTVLVLCSFHEDYKKYWTYVSNKIQNKTPKKKIVRMLDILSPRLVGQALYEHIRWSPCCIVDWSRWRANVFFELGVRLACSDIGPIFLVEKNETTINKTTKYAIQKARLFELLKPYVYQLNGPKAPFDEAFSRYEAIINKQDLSFRPSGLNHNDIYRVIIESYDWAQEQVTRRPDEELRANVEAKLGPDPQKTGGSQVLFWSNPQFKKELERNVQERWIAAWYYLRNRYTVEDLHVNAEARKQLTSIGETALQWLSRSLDRDHERIRREIEDEVLELEEP